MRKFLLSAISLIFSLTAMASCGELLAGSGFFDGFSLLEQNSASEQTVKKYTVTFKQTGYADVVKKVAKGEDLTDIPTPKGKTGYTVEWEKADLKDIDRNIVVQAVTKANVYAVYYDANGGEVENEAQKVTYDSAFTLETPTREGYVFIAWETEDGKAVTDGTWKTAGDLSVIAKWTEVEKATVSFVQNGQTTKTYEVEIGTKFKKKNIPEPEAKTGYDVEWNAEDLKKLNEAVSAPVNVTAVETAKTYTVTVRKNDGSSASKVSVTYDSDYDFGIPTRAGYDFVGWTLNGESIEASGVWATDLDGAGTVSAEWSAKKYTVNLVVDGSVWQSVTVTYGEEYELPKPSVEGKKFNAWRKDGAVVTLTGTWTWTSASGVIELKCQWVGSSDWTGRY